MRREYRNKLLLRPFPMSSLYPPRTEAGTGAPELVRDVRAYDGYHQREMPGAFLFFRPSPNEKRLVKTETAKTRKGQVRDSHPALFPSGSRTSGLRSNGSVHGTDDGLRSAPWSHRLRSTDKKFERTAVYNKTGTALTRESLRLGDRGGTVERSLLGA